MEKLSASDIEEYYAMEKSLKILAFMMATSGGYFISKSNIYLSLSLFVLAATFNKTADRLTKERIELDPNGGFVERLAKETEKDRNILR